MQNYITDIEMDDYSADEIEPVVIGRIIEEELRAQKQSVAWLSRTIHCDRRNVYDIFTRSSIDTGLLMRISCALHTDFFSYYSSVLHF